MVGTTQKGYVDTGFIVETAFPQMYIERFVDLAPFPGMSGDELGNKAFGWSGECLAIVLFETDGYWFVITQEGFTGYTMADHPYTTPYQDPLLYY